MSAPVVAASCPSCGARSEQVPASLVGRNVRCPRCQATFRVPAPERVDPPTRLEDAPATTPEAPLATTPEAAAPAAEAPASLEAAPLEWPAGTLVAGLYEITGLLGQGGMGRVYKAHHRAWDLDLAVKTPLPQVLAAAGGAAAFEREAETWVNLGLHPHVVTCYYVRRLSGVPRVFAEFVDGGSLLDWIRAGRIDRVETLLDIAIQFAWGLHYAHEQGLVHRDVKPANVLLSASGQAKVTDFGLARAGALALPAAVAGRGGSIVVAGGAAGTPAYMSPEQLAGEPLGRRSDLWSFALSVLEMFVGERTWDYGTAAPEVLRAHLANGGGRVAMPEAVAALLQRCFDDAPEKRPRDLAEAAAALVAAWSQSAGGEYPRAAPRAGQGTADSLNNRGVSFLDLERPRDAVAAWDAALAAEPQHPEATFNRTLHEWSAGRLDDGDAERRIAEVVKSHGNAAHVHHLAARLHMALGDFGRAVSELAAARQLGAPDAELARERAQALAGQAAVREDRAAWTLVRDAFETTLALGAGEPSDVAGHALALERLGDAAGATTFYREATRRRSDLPAELDSAIRTLVPGQERLSTLRGLQAAALALAVTPDGREIVAGGGGREARVWDRTSGALLRKIVSEDGRLRALAVTPDGRLLVWAAEEAPLRVFDLAQGRLLRACVRQGGSPQSLALTQDGRGAVVGSSDRSVRLFDLETGQLQRSFEGHEDGVVAVAAGPTRVVSGSRDGTVRVWDTATGAAVAVHRGHAGRVTAVALDEARQRVVSGGDDRSVRLWPWSEGTAEALVWRGATQAISSVALDPEGRFLTSGSLDRGLRFVELASGRLFALVRLEAAVHAIVETASGLVVGHGSLVSRVERPVAPRVPPPALVRPSSSSELQERQARFESGLAAARAHREAGDLDLALDALTAARAVPGHERADAALDAWDALAAELPRASLRGAWEERALAGHAQQVLAVAAAGSLVASGGNDREVRLQDRAGSAAPRLLAGHEGPVSALAFFPDASRLVSGSWDHTLRLWSAADGAPLGVCAGHESYVLAAAVSRDGLRIASASLDHSLRLWRADGTPERVLSGHAAGASAVAWSPDGRVLVSGGWDGSVRAWNPETGAAVALLEGHAGNVNAVAVSPRGASVASGGSDGSVRLWDLEERRESARLAGHSAEITAVHFLPDGRYLVSASRDASVRVWNLASGRCERVLAHTGAVLGAGLFPRGERLATGGADGAVRVFHLDWEPQRPEARLRLKPQTLRPTSAPAMDTVVMPAEDASRWDAVRRGSVRPSLRPSAAARAFPWRNALLAAAALLIVGASVRAWLGRRPSLHLVSHVVASLKAEPDLIRLESFREPCDAGGTDVYLARAQAAEVSAPDLACLAGSHDPAVVAPYLATLSLADPDPFRSKRLFRNAVSLLVGLGEPAAEPLCAVLGDARDDVRRVAATALAVAASDAARACLLRTMRAGESGLARATALGALPRLLADARVAPEEGARLVQAYVADADPAVRAAALATLVVFNQDFGRPLAETARRDPDPAVAQAAASALAAIDGARRGEAIDGQP